MPQYPPEVQQMYDVLLSLDGVSSAELGLIDLTDVDMEALSLPHMFGDLPQVAIRRTSGGRKNEKLVTMTLRFDPSAAGWVAMEFLSWWVRDLARNGSEIQMRSLGLPPMGPDIQLGGTLKFVIELFVIDPSEGCELVQSELSALAESLRSSMEQYSEALANPVLEDVPEDEEEHEQQEEEEGHHHCHHDVGELRAAAESGDPGAMFHLAQHLEAGDGGVDADPEAAFRMYARAAEQEFPPAQLFLGRCYEHGIGVEADPHQAIKYYRKAAVDDLPVAMGMLGWCYENGIGVPIDLSQATKWYRKGAELEDSGCQAQLAECLELGRGVERNLPEALRWYQAAKKQGMDVTEGLARVKSSMQQHS
ncbi:MAG: sel1 repeat family protein [Planctomycetales bacterium]|nr:sel1 repeat family protein [Planctomycetales bacterium]